MSNGTSVKPQIIKMFGLFITCCLVLSTFLGCGYTTRSLIQDNFKTIYISPFLNKIDITSEAKSSTKYQVYQPLLETDLTRTIIDRFILDGNLRIVKKEAADLILEGALVDFRKDVLRYAADETTPEEYRISVAVDISLWDKKENKLIWKEKNFIGDTTYFLSGPNAKSDDNAISDVTSDIARRVVARVIENW